MDDVPPPPPLPPLEAPEQQEPPVEEQGSASASASASAVHDTLVAPAAASTSASSGLSSSGSPSSSLVLLHPSAASDSNISSNRKRKRIDNGNPEDEDDVQQQQPRRRQREENGNHNDDGDGDEHGSGSDSDSDSEPTSNDDGKSEEDGLELPRCAPSARAGPPPRPTRRRSSSASSSPPPPPPDVRQYFALWQTYDDDWKQQQEPSATGGGEKNPTAAAGTARCDIEAQVADAPTAAAGTPTNEEDKGIGGATAVTSDPTNNVVQRWEDELVLAAHNDHVRSKVQFCFDRVQEHERAIQELKRQIGACQSEAYALKEQERQRIEVLPSLTRAGHADYVWRDCKSLTPEVKRSTELAWALLHAKDSSLPLPFQKMLWMDPSCPLRNDRQILMASIDKGLDQLHVDIVWTHEWANDREFVLTCFRKCPGCMSVRNLDPDPIKPYLKDMEALRAFALSPHRCPYRSSGYAKRPGGIHTQFSRTLFTDPDFMADLFVHLCRRCGNDAWARARLKKAFPQLEWTAPPKKVGGGGDPTATTRKPAPTSSKTSDALLDNVAFAIRVAEGLAGLPQENRAQCPVTYATLARRVQKDSRVALAFVKVDARVAGWAPLSLRRNKDVWNQLWTAATNQDPRMIYHESLKSAPCKSLLSSKDLVLRLLETACTRGGDGVDEFATFFSNFARSIRHDRDVNIRLVVSWAKVRGHSLRGLIRKECINSRDFWTDLPAQQPSCSCAALKLVPKELANDEGLALLWARDVCPDGASDWFTCTVAKFPNLNLLSDRHVLLNWLPKLCRSNPTSEQLRTQVPPEVLADSSLWIELFQKLGSAYNILKYIPEPLRSNPDVVEAQLQCAAKRDKALARCFGTMSPPLRFRFLSYIVRAIQNSDPTSFDQTWRPFAERFKLYRFPEAVLAVLSKGGRFQSHEFWRQPWRKDPDFLLRVADATATHPSRRIFWDCCSDTLLRDKSFLLRLLKDAMHVPELMLEDTALERDYDIMFARFVRMPASKVREFLHCRPHHNRGNDRRDENVQFARQVRARLQSYVSLQVFMSGVITRSANGGAESSATIPLQMLGQDDDTVSDFNRRLVEYLGCPDSVDEASDLRTVSNKLILAGY